MADIDHIRVAIALARSARWIGGTSIAVAAALLVGLFAGRPLPTLAALALCLAILSGIAVIYLMFRIELDRTLFEAAASVEDQSAYFAGFDQSRSQLGLGEAEPGARPVSERVLGMIQLVRTMGTLFAVQMFFAVAGVWMGRWLS